MAGGFLTGTAAFVRIPPTTALGGAGATWAADCYNVTTVRYRPNYKRVCGTTWCSGVAENHGPNNPLQSAHSGGLLAGMTDGSVQFIAQTTDLAILLRLAIRDDGQSVQIQ